ncbi:hypothetical protein KNO81_40575 [Paraburkholderia sediminicola]|nr:hypothetical protein [Paraburkholderia sediminicola]
MHLTPEQRQALCDASIDGFPAIQRLLDQLRRANPDAFHPEETLATRRFQHEPLRYVPNSGFVDSIASGRTALVMNGWRSRRT